MWLLLHQNVYSFNRKDVAASYCNLVVFDVPMPILWSKSMFLAIWRYNQRQQYQYYVGPKGYPKGSQRGGWSFADVAVFSFQTLQLSYFDIATLWLIRTITCQGRRHRFYHSKRVRRCWQVTSFHSSMYRVRGPSIGRENWTNTAIVSIARLNRRSRTWREWAILL